jgi:hypothetical protein
MILFRSETPLDRGLAPIHTANAALATLKCEPETPVPLFRAETLTLLFRLPTHFVLLLRSQAVGYVVLVLVLRTQAV